MQHGNLSNKVMPSLVIVFEGAVGTLPQDKIKNYTKAVSKGRWWEAIDLFELNPSMLSKMLDVTWNKGYQIELCTWMSYDEEYTPATLAIEDRMNSENIPIYSVWASKPERLARELAYLPRIARVYDPDPSHVFTYGGKGVYLTDPNQLGAY